MSALSALKSNSREYTNFTQLPAGEYQIQKFAKVETPKGERLRVDLNEYYVFLPERYLNGINEEKLAELNNGKYVMVFKGKNTQKQDR